MSVSERLARYNAPGSTQSRVVPDSAMAVPGVAPVPNAIPTRVPNPAPWWMGAIPAAGGMIGGAIGGAGGTIGGFGIGGVPGAIGGGALGTAGGEAIRQNLARTMGYDAPESPQEALGEIGEAGKSGAIGGAIGAGGGRVASVLAKAPFLKRIWGAGMVRGMSEDAAEVGARIRGGQPMPRFGPQAAAAEEAVMPALQGTSRAAMRPLVGGEEAEAFRRAGLEGVEALRAEAGSAASRVGNEASEAGRALAKKRWSAPKPKGKVVGKIEPKPKVGSAESRVAKGEKAPQRAKRLRQRQKDNRRSLASNEKTTARGPTALDEPQILSMQQKAYRITAEMGLDAPTQADLLHKIANGIPGRTALEQSLQKEFLKRLTQ